MQVSFRGWKRWPTKVNALAWRAVAASQHSASVVIFSWSLISSPVTALPLETSKTDDISQLYIHASD